MHEVHVLFPPAEYFDGTHSSHVFVIIDAIVPGSQYSHSMLPALLTTYPFVLSQGKHALAAAPECFPTSHFAHASALLPLYHAITNRADRFTFTCIPTFRVDSSRRSSHQLQHKSRQGGQDVEHDGDPSPLNSPASHAMQRSALGPLYLPPTHKVHDAAPVPLLFPAAQSEQAAEPPTLDVPLNHNEQPPIHTRA